MRPTDALSHPAHWSTTTVRRGVEVKRGVSWSKEQEHGEPGPNRIPVIGIRNVQDCLELNDLVYLSGLKPTAVEKSRVSAGWTVMVGSNGNRARIGNAVLVREDAEFLFASFLMGAKPTANGGLSSDYFYRWLSTEQVQAYLTASSEGTTGLNNLSHSFFRAMSIPVPPPDEQAAIARILDAVDTALERTRARLVAAKALTASLTEEAVSGKLITGGMPSCEQRAWSHPRLGGIPAGWSVDRLGKLCARIVDGTHQAVETSRSGVPFLYVSCVREGRILWKSASFISERTYARISKGREPQTQCVLYTAVGSYGNAALVSTGDPFGLQRHIAILYPKTARLRGDYLTLWLNSSKGKRWSEIHAVGNAQKTVTLTELGKLLIAFPPPYVQAELCNVVAGAEAVVDTINGRLDGLADLKRSLMHDLLTGRVRVRDDSKGTAS